MDEEEMDRLVAETVSKISDRFTSEVDRFIKKEKREMAFAPLRKVEKELQTGCHPNHRDDDGKTPLMRASEHCNEETEESALQTMRSLLEKGAEVDARDQGGQTALFKTTNLAMQLLLANGADPNAVDSDGVTPLVLAVRRRSLSDVRALLDSRAKCSDWPIGRASAMQKAIEDEEFDIGRLFLEHGANVKEVDETGCGLMHLVQITDWRSDCLESHRLEFAKLLTDRGAPCDLVDHKGRSALHLAMAEGRSKKMVRFLIDHGAPVDAVDHNGDTALIAARTPAIARLLLERGAKCSYWPVGHPSAVHKAIVYSQFEMVRLLLEHGADPLEVDKEGKSLMHWVQYNPYVAYPSEAERLKMAELLVELGVPCDLSDLKGHTALHTAVIERRPEEMIEFLLANGAPLNAADYKGETTLMVASELCQIASHEQALGPVRYLLERGAEVDARDWEGRTALWRASPECVELLLEHGADPNAIDKHGQTPLFGAVGDSDTAKAKALLAGGAKISDWCSGNYSPIHAAISVRQLELCRGVGDRMLELFIEHGANMKETDPFGRSLMHWVQLDSGLASDLRYSWDPWEPEDRMETARLLVEHGAPYDLVDSKGRTALHYAAVEGQSEEMMRFLLNQGVPLDAVDHEEKTAFELAREHEVEPSIKILERLAGER